MSHLFSSDSRDTRLGLVVCLDERSRPEVRVGHRRKLFGDAIFILAAELSIAFPTTPHNQEPQRGIGHVRLSLCPLLRPVEQEGAQASVFVAVLNLESPSLQSVTVASASRDVLQRLQVPNPDA
jgi:hypothetical protein